MAVGPLRDRPQSTLGRRHLPTSLSRFQIASTFDMIYASLWRFTSNHQSSNGSTVQWSLSRIVHHYHSEGKLKSLKSRISAARLQHQRQQHGWTRCLLLGHEMAMQVGRKVFCFQRAGRSPCKAGPQAEPFLGTPSRPPKLLLKFSPTVPSSASTLENWLGPWSLGSESC